MDTVFECWVKTVGWSGNTFQEGSSIQVYIHKAEALSYERRASYRAEMKWLVERWKSGLKLSFGLEVVNIFEPSVQE